MLTKHSVFATVLLVLPAALLLSVPALNAIDNPSTDVAQSFSDNFDDRLLADLSNVVFIPNNISLVKGGAAQTIHASFDGTVNSNDDFHNWIAFKVIDDDPYIDDVLLRIEIPCMASASGTNFHVEMDFRLQATAECDFEGVDVLFLQITDPNSGQDLCGTPAQPNVFAYTESDDSDHRLELKMEDDPDNGNHGQATVSCAGSVPAVSGWSTILMGALLIILASALLFRRTRILVRS